MNHEERKHREERSGMLIGGTIVMGVGLLFLLVNLDVLPGLHDTWPVFIIIVGIALIIGGFSKKKKTGEFPGS